MTLPASLTVAGSECPLRRERDIVPDMARARYAGRRGDVSILIEAIVREDGSLVSDAWEGIATVTVRWTTAEGSTHDRHQLPWAAGSTPESCAATLTEIVRSVAAALAGVGS